MLDVTVVTVVVSAIIGGIVPAVAVVATVRAQIEHICDDINDLKHGIRRAHSRLNTHIKNTHKQS